MHWYKGSTMTKKTEGYTFYQITNRITASIYVMIFLFILTSCTLCSVNSFINYAVSRVYCTNDSFKPLLFNYLTSMIKQRLSVHWRSHSDYKWADISFHPT